MPSKISHYIVLDSFWYLFEKMNVFINQFCSVAPNQWLIWAMSEFSSWLIFEHKSDWIVIGRNWTQHDILAGLITGAEQYLNPKFDRWFDDRGYSPNKNFHIDVFCTHLQFFWTVDLIFWSPNSHFLFEQLMINRP